MDPLALPDDALPDDEAASAKKSQVDFLPAPQAVAEPVKSSDEVSEVDRLRAEVKRLEAKLNDASK